MNTVLVKMNTQLFKKYIGNPANFNVIFANCSDFVVKQILSYRFKNGCDWKQIGRYLHMKPDTVRFILSRYLKANAIKSKPIVDGKVLHKAQTIVDEYNRTHGTNYSYGQYVHFVESRQKGVSL